MDWLIDWLKQLVIIVLIATCIDLMLPNNSMERYMKLVLSLLIIVVMLNPILHMINQDIKTFSLNLPNENPSESFPVIEEINQNADRFKENQLKLIQEQTRQQIEEKMTQKLEQELSVDVTNIEVELDQKNGQIEIKRILVNIIADKENCIEKAKKLIETNWSISPKRIEVTNNA